MFQLQTLQPVQFAGQHSSCPLCRDAAAQTGFLVNANGLAPFVARASHIHRGTLYEVSLRYCPGCDFGYFFPAPPDDLLAAYYQAGGGGQQRSDEQALQWGASFAMQQEMDAIAAFMCRNRLPPEQLRGEPVLEIGSGYGAFQAFAREHGMQATAVEPGEQTAAFAERQFGTRVLRCMIADVPDELLGSFALVFSKDSLEHHADPLASLQRMQQLLRPGGSLLLSVPNLNAFSLRALAYSHPHFAFPAHLNYFSRQAFQTTLQRLGLVDIVIRCTSFVAEIGYCMEACIKLGLARPDWDTLAALEQKDQLERLLVLARKPA